MVPFDDLDQRRDGERFGQVAGAVELAQTRGWDRRGTHHEDRWAARRGEGAAAEEAPSGVTGQIDVQENDRRPEAGADEFAALLKQKFKPRSDRVASEVESGVQALVTEALDDRSLVKSEVIDTIEAMIADINNKASKFFMSVFIARSSRSMRSRPFQSPSAGAVPGIAVETRSLPAPDHFSTR